MERACQADNSARLAGQPALHKLKLLPEVAGILNRNNVQHAVLDPDTNFLQHVKFFLEPLNDGSLPAYNIQRDIFTALTRLNIEKETLLSSGIGKVVLFYTRSKKPEPSIKRMAERLLGEWSRPILKRTDDYKKRHIETREFDYEYVSATITSPAFFSLYACWLTMDDTGLPKWPNAANKALSSLSLSGLLSLLQMPSVSDSSPPFVVATRLAWSTFPQVTQLLL
jgi:hypothetical protein